MAETYSVDNASGIVEMLVLEILSDVNLERSSIVIGSFLIAFIEISKSVTFRNTNICIGIYLKRLS